MLKKVKYLKLHLYLQFFKNLRYALIAPNVFFFKKEKRFLVLQKYLLTYIFKINYTFSTGNNLCCFNFLSKETFLKSLLQYKQNFCIKYNHFYFYFTFFFNKSYFLFFVQPFVFLYKLKLILNKFLIYLYSFIRFLKKKCLFLF